MGGVPTTRLLCATAVALAFGVCARPFVVCSTEDEPSVTAPLRCWEFIVIHHSATSTGSAAVFDAAHRARGMTNGLAYHFVVNNGTRSTMDSQVETGERWIKQLPGGHCRQEIVNERGIGICLVGDFSEAQPTAKQMDSLVALIQRLQAQFRITDDHVVGHEDFFGESTECPGTKFPWDALRKRLAGKPTATASSEPQLDPAATEE